MVEQKTEVVEQKTELLENKLESLNASNIKYDDGSTLYSAMGDIDSLETTSKNLVGAINELSEGGGSGEIIYSTDEKIIGKWIDNTNVYEKTVVLNMGNTTHSQMTRYALGINARQIISFSGVAYNGYGTYFPLVCYENASYNLNTYLDTTAIHIRNIGWACASATVTVRYLKTE